jgi:hypothetical protein
MSEVKRYDTKNLLMSEGKEGSYVLYSDYEALKKRQAAMSEAIRISILAHDNNGHCKGTCWLPMDILRAALKGTA